MKRVSTIAWPIIIIVIATMLVAQTATFTAMPVPQATPSTLPPPPPLPKLDPTPLIIAYQQSSDVTNWLYTGLQALDLRETGDILNINNRITGIPAGPRGDKGDKGDKGDPGPPGSGGLPSLQVTTSNITAASVPVRLNPIPCYPTIPSAGWISVVGQSMDFTWNVTSAGSYILTSCVGSAGTTAVYRIEYPIGTKIGASLTVPMTSWTSYAYQDATARLNLPQGPAVIRIVCETPGFNYAGFNLHF